MTRASTLILIGVLTLVVPFSGLPSFLRTLLVVVLGASAAGVGLAMRLADVRAAKAVMPVRPSDIEPVKESVLTAALAEDHQSPQKFSSI